MDTVSAKAPAWTGEYGGSVAAAPAEAAVEADTVLTCVGDDPDGRCLAVGFPDGTIVPVLDAALGVLIRVYDRRGELPE